MWSKIQDTALAQHAVAHIAAKTLELGLLYHNVDHVMGMYQYLEDTNEPYDPVLDWAVLFHDFVYDDQPEKEYRSAVAFSNWKKHYSGCDLNVLDEGTVAAMILATERHVVTSRLYSAIIRADLHQLTNAGTTVINFGNILQENVNLYKVDRGVCATKSKEYMYAMRQRIEKNEAADPAHANFYNKVTRGIDDVIMLNNMILQRF